MFTIPRVFFILWRMQQDDNNGIRIENVTFSYKADTEGGTDKRALSGVSMEIERGSYVAVIGANGSGKSTLARLINTLAVPDEGKITVLGLDASEGDNPYRIRQKCSCVFQNPDNQIVGTIVEEDVAFGPENLAIPNPELRQRVDDALKATGLYDMRRQQAASLSGGQKQKLAIAGALAMKPEILILDESTAMLDPVSRDEFLTLVERMRREHNLTLITITHDMNEAARCGKIFVLSKGQLIASGTPMEIFSDEKLIMRAGLNRPVHYRFLSRLSEITSVPLSADMDINDPATASGVAADMIIKGISSGRTFEYTRPPKPPVKDDTKVIEISDLKYGYDESSFRLDNINLTVMKSELLAIVGQSGCGKTTLISHLNALVTPESGKVLIYKDGQTWNTSVKKDIRKIRGIVGLVFQYPEYQLFEETVYSDVAYGLKRMGVPDSEHDPRIREAIRLVGLDESVLRASPFELSGGQKRRVAMAGVLVMRPEVLVLDEPACGLDPDGRAEMFRIIANLKKEGTTIILVTHNMDDAALYADRICCIKRGRILAVARPEELFGDQERCRELGIDIPVVSSFSASVRAKISEMIEGVSFDNVIYDPEEEACSVYAAALRSRGGLSCSST